MSCKAVQTNDDIAKDYLWKDYTYFSGQTDKIIQHFADFASRLKQDFFHDQDDVQVLDIGSNDGSLLKQFTHHGCKVVGIDPAETVVTIAVNNGIDTKLGLFSKQTSRQHFNEGQFDVITAFNVFAHSADMQEMAAEVTRCLKKEGIFCFEVQYLGDIVEKDILGTVFHEHMIHYSLKSAQPFLRRYGLEIIDFERNSIQNGSIIFKACHLSSELIQMAQVEKLSALEDYEHHIGIDSTDWAHGFRERISNIRDQAQNYLANKKKVCAYGAARSGPTIAIQYGIEEKISCLFDDHPSKCGKFSPFRALSVRRTADLRVEEYDHTVILAYIHYKPIIRNNMDYLRSGGKFIMLWPFFKVVDINNLGDLGL
jgi:SAM-dependent methyltransferase